MAPKNTTVTNLAITMFYNLQNCIMYAHSITNNAKEDINVTLGHFVEIEMASKMTDSMSIMEMQYFSRCALFFAFLKAHTFMFQKMVDISTHLSHFDILIIKGGIKDGYQNTLVTNVAITMFYNLQNASFMYISSLLNAIEELYVTLGHFVKIKVASKMADSRFIMEMPIFFRFALFFDF